VDSTGIPLSAVLSPGQSHESKYVEPVLDAVQLWRAHPQNGNGTCQVEPRRLAGDKGYSYASVRQALGQRGIQAVIPTRKDQEPDPRFDRTTYRRRNVVERLVGWLKESRRLATRFEKLAVNFLAMVKLAMFQRCLRLLESSDRT
jgi:transposase